MIILDTCSLRVRKDAVYIALIFAVLIMEIKPIWCTIYIFFWYPDQFGYNIESHGLKKIYP